MLNETIPMDGDLYERPDLAALGIRSCRECGCTDDHACEGGCAWLEDDLCSQCAPQRQNDGPTLGACCICGGTEAVHNIIMLSRRGVVSGHGWGCVVCHLPMDGAYAVLCDRCLPAWEADNSVLVMACRGYPASEGRIPIAELPEGVFDHDPEIDHNG
jgi:hypothetical protein